MNKTVYQKELEIIEYAVKTAYSEFFSYDNLISKDKGKFDVVTNNDYRIEEYLIRTIESNFPGDKILSEETNATTKIQGRTWTIDPIDGTYNMTRRSPLFGIQCALYIDDEIVFSVVYLPMLKEFYHAEKDCGAFLNGKRIAVVQNDLEHSAVSFGDFPHRRIEDFQDEHRIMDKLSSSIAKIRMFGSACIDFVYLASGRTDGTIIFTKNKWDIAPGILIASEAGAIIRSLDGDYSESSRVVIATATNDLYGCIVDCYQ